MSDRTQEFSEFTTLLKRIKVSSGNGTSSSSISSVSSTNKDKDRRKCQSRTAFNEAAAEVAEGIYRSANLVNKLTNLVKRQGLFDDPTEEINKLIFRIKTNLDDLNVKCDSAQKYIDSKKGIFGTEDQSSSHNNKVVSNLKIDLMHATKDFKKVLELRSSKMKDHHNRKEEMLGKGLFSPIKMIDGNHQTENKIKNGGSEENSRYRNDNFNKFVTPYEQNSSRCDNFGGVSTCHEMEEQQLLLNPLQNDQYYDKREKAVTEVEQTIGELGQLFNRLATMISEQQELVERVDEDIEEARSNADRAQNALMQTYEKVSSNRGMYMKIGVIMVLFFIFFVMFML